MKKYELTDETIEVNGIKLYRIKALVDFSDVKAGDLGCFIQRDDKLPHGGVCRIYNSAVVYDKAVIIESARMYNNSDAYENARVYGAASVYGNADVSEDDRLY